MCGSERMWKLGKDVKTVRDKGGFWKSAVLKLSDWVAVEGRQVMQGLQWYEGEKQREVGVWVGRKGCGIWVWVCRREGIKVGFGRW